MARILQLFLVAISHSCPILRLYSQNILTVWHIHTILTIPYHTKWLCILKYYDLILEVHYFHLTFNSGPKMPSKRRESCKDLRNHTVYCMCVCAICTIWISFDKSTKWKLSQSHKAVWVTHYQQKFHVFANKNAFFMPVRLKL